MLLTMRTGRIKQATPGGPAMDMETTLRKGTLSALVEMLKAQNDVKYDIVVNASRLRYEAGILHVLDGAVRFDGDGATECDAQLVPTDVFEENASARLGIPRAYLRTLRESMIRFGLPPNFVDMNTLLD